MRPTDIVFAAVAAPAAACMAVALAVVVVVVLVFVPNDLKIRMCKTQTDRKAR